MAHYPFREIETKWQKRWLETKRYRTPNPGSVGFDPSKKPFYVLDMFPYPSGSGLHVGHASGYIGTDIVARKKRMDGFNVLHPMGWDAFGLPAEQYALSTGQHPRQTTDLNTENFRKQLMNIGLSYDWDREIDTSLPSYYKWTQWIFLQLYKKGLVERKQMPVWWCEELKTVLANEEVINGRSERGNYLCVRKPLTQWVFKITHYAERLLEDLALLDWPESVKKMQSDWIGKSEGAEIEFQALDSKDQPKIKVFTTRPDTLFGVTALVLAPEHPLVEQLTTPEQKQSVEAYRNKTLSKSDRERKADVDKISACALGRKVRHPLLPSTEIPVYIADYVLLDYGTGAVMAVPAHDERDFDLAKVAQLAVKRVIHAEGVDSESCYTGEGVLQNSGEFSGMSSAEARKAITQALVQKGVGAARTTYKLRDWIFSRQRYWGEPFPLLIDQNDQVQLVDDQDLPVVLPDMKVFAPNEDGSSPLNRVPEWVNVVDKSGEKFSRVTDTMPGWAGSCWYYLRFMDPTNTKEAFSREALNYWKRVDLYVGGASHAVMHLLYARFWHKVLYDLGLVTEKEPFLKLFNQGMVTAFAFKDSTGRLVPNSEVEQRGQDYFHKSKNEKIERFISKMAKSLGNVVNPNDVIQAKGCDAFRMYEMFMGPLDSEKPWTDDGISGCEGFLKKLWNTLHTEEGALKTFEATENPRINKALHKALKRINDSFEVFNFNIAIAAMMEALNEIRESGAHFTQGQLEIFVKMLSPFAPHLSAELWEKLGHTSALDFEAWPTFEARHLVESEFELVLQVNGKIRKKQMVAMNTPEEELKKLGLSELQEWIGSAPVVRIVAVKNKLVNVVVKA